MGVFVIGAVTSLLPKMIGPQRAKELMLFGEPFDAHQALKVGIARKVVPEDTLFDEAEATARRIIELPEGAVRNLKRVLNRAYHMDVEGAMQLETDATVRGFLDELLSKVDGAVKSRFLMRVGWVIIVHVYFTRPTDRRIV